MMTQSVMTQAANLFNNTSESVNLKGKQTGSDFHLFIDSSLKATQDVAGNADSTIERKTAVQATDTQSSMKSDGMSNTDTTTDALQKDTATKVDTSKEPEQKTSSVSNDKKTSTSEVTVESEQTDQSLVNDIMTQITAMLQSIQEAVMKALNLSPEEFEQLLTSQEMSAVDLLQPENLQQLVLADNGQTDILSVLTDENLADTMKQLIQTVDGIKSENNFGLTLEQIKSIFTQLEAQPEAQMDPQVETVTNAMLAKVQNAGSKEEPVNQPDTVKSSNITDSTMDYATITVTDKNTQTDILNSATTSESSNTGTQTGTDRESDNNLEAPDQFQTFVDNLVQASQNKQFDLSGDIAQVTELREIATQIIERIKVSITSDQTSMELQLNPESLGKINLSVQSKDGVMTAHFVVQNEISKEAIESQIHTLRDTLNNQGIKVDAIEVTVSANAFDQNNSNGSNNQTDTQKKNAGKHISLEEALNMSEVPENESSTEDVSGVMGSIIDYTA